MRSENELSLAQQAAAAKEAAKRQRKENFCKMLTQWLFWCILGTALAAIGLLLLWLNLNMYSGVALAMAKVGFVLFLVGAVDLVVVFIGTVSSRFGASDVAALVLSIVITVSGFIAYGILLDNSKGRLWIDGYVVDPEGSGVIYTENSDGDIVIVGVEAGNTSVTVKSEYDGLKVVRITSTLLKDSTVEEVTILGGDDDDIITVAKNCFTNGESLKKVVFRGGSFSVGKVAQDCRYLESVKFEDCTVELNTATQKCFINCNRLKTVEVVGSELTVNGANYAPFYECSEFNMTVSNSTVLNFSGDIHTLVLSGACRLEMVHLGGRIKVDEVVFARDYDFKNSSVMNRDAKSETTYFALSQSIYIPNEAADTVGDSWFGDIDEGTVHVYCEAEYLSWSESSFNSVGNQNHNNQKTVFHYGSTHDAWVIPSN
ncbi:MAG: hypothetical protein IKB34_03100 [Clostridia bacterium]|nr:hypothetical protein [Clostridia bacterium]